MAGIDLKLGSPVSGAVVTSPFGKAQPYEGVWDSTIALWDSGYNPETGIPANASTVRNLRRDRLAAVSGLSLADCDFVIKNDISTGFIAGERTSKKGIHIASTQNGAQNANAAFQINPPAAMANWIASQQDAGNDYAMMLTVWVRPTRDYVGNNPAPQPLSYMANNDGPSATSNFFIHSSHGQVNVGRRLDTNAVGYSPATGAPGCQRILASDQFPQVLALASQGWEGTKDNTPETSFLGVGSASAWGGFNLNKAASYILYRMQLDLISLSEIAGASVADKANAILAAHNTLKTRDFASGGRFADDVFTPAATLKP